MNALFPAYIPKVDALAEERLGLSTETLIRRAGEAIAQEVAARVAPCSVLALCGGGNNGADGYAACLALAHRGFSVLAVDVFGKGQRTEGGQALLQAYTAAFGPPLSLAEAMEREAHVYIDAVLGTGATGPLSEEGKRLAAWLRERKGFRVAVDLPLGVDAALGRVQEPYVPTHLTVMLAFAKIGLASYPARAACGETVVADIGLACPEIVGEIPMHTILDCEYVKKALPKREKDSHKGSFGTAALVVGSPIYRGAATLAATGALRMGAGLVQVFTHSVLFPALTVAAPEAVLRSVEDGAQALSALATATAVAVGSGCGQSEELFGLVKALLEAEGGPLLLDADALNVLAASEDGGRALLRGAARPVLLTPHPKELARLCGKEVEAVQRDRLGLAMAYAKEQGVTLLLKGAGTVITDGERVHVCPFETSALAKGGSGDVLTGMATAFLAQGASPMDALSLAAYLHGSAATALAAKLSEYGVLPSDLPRAAAEEICRILREDRCI